jgi:hypothetical protein
MPADGVGILGGQIRGDGTVPPLTDDEEFVIRILDDERPLPRRNLMLEPDHLTNVLEVTTKLRIEPRPHDLIPHPLSW